MPPGLELEYRDEIRRVNQSEAIGALLMYQANRNLIDRVARALGVRASRF